MPRFFRKARHLLKHPEELIAFLAVALKQAYARRGALVKIFEDFLLLFRLVKSWVSGEYKDVPRSVVFWAILAIVYFVSPLDAFPDLFPGGLLDDIAFITFVLDRIRKDLEKFDRWEKKSKL